MEITTHDALQFFAGEQKRMHLLTTLHGRGDAVIDAPGEIPTKIWPAGPAEAPAWRRCTFYKSEP